MHGFGDPRAIIHSIAKRMNFAAIILKHPPFGSIENQKATIVQFVVDFGVWAVISCKVLHGINKIDWPFFRIERNLIPSKNRRN